MIAEAQVLLAPTHLLQPPAPPGHLPHPCCRTCSMPTALAKVAPIDCSCSPAWELRRWPASADSACREAMEGRVEKRHAGEPATTPDQPWHATLRAGVPWARRAPLLSSPAGGPPPHPVVRQVSRARCATGRVDGTVSGSTTGNRQRQHDQSMRPSSRGTRRPHAAGTARPAHLSAMLSTVASCCCSSGDHGL